ncbi:MAG: O-antigen ligase family protein [Hyphomicrobiales bacterium]|nr:O-antigen ligase family protein [Hyphomicrobiales bacterium]
MSVSILTLVFVGISAAMIGGTIAFLGDVAYALLYCSFVFALIIFANYRNGIWLLALLLPFASTQLVPRQLFGVIGLNPFNILFVLTLLSLFAASAFRREDINFVSLPTTFLIYVGVVSLGAYVGVGSVEKAIVIPPNFEPLTKTAYLLEFVKSLIMLAVAWLAAILSRNGNGRSVIWALAAAYVTFSFVIACYLVVNGITLESLATGESTPTAFAPVDRNFLNWTGLHANEVGLLANIGFAILLYTALATSAPWSRAILLACAGAAATMAALTFSRAAFVGIGITLGYYAWKQRSMGRFLLALSAIVTVALLLPDAFLERASTGLATWDEQAITAGRLDQIWRPLIGTFWEAPIIGHGLYSTQWATPNLRGEMLPVDHPHSAYLAVALDHGIVGVVVVAVFFWSVWRTFSYLSKHHVDPQWRGVFEGCMVCLLCLASDGLTDGRFTPVPQQAALWLCYGLALGQAQSTGSTKNSAHFWRRLGGSGRA